MPGSAYPYQTGSTYQYFTNTSSTTTVQTVPWDQVWTGWVTLQTGNCSAMSLVTNNQIWQGWVDYQDWQQAVYEPTPAWTSEQREGQRLALAQAEARRMETERQRHCARARSRSLLLSLLSPEQKAEFEANRRIPVVGSCGRRYRIEAQGVSGNVHLLADDKAEGGLDIVQARLCAHPAWDDDKQGYLPNEDQWLAQMLHLQTDEEDFLRKANVHGGRLPVLRAA